MPRYLASHHAVARLLERFPALAPVAGHGLAAAQWLGRLTARVTQIPWMTPGPRLVRLTFNLTRCLPSIS